MDFEQDYVKRLINSISKIIFATVAGKNAIENNIKNENYDIKISEDDLLEIMVKKYIAEENINKAENLIFESIQKSNSQKSYKIALDFYNSINKYSDERLAKYNFSRQEIKNGLIEIEKIHNADYKWH